jgi:hypothetical protein
VSKIFLRVKKKNKKILFFSMKRVRSAEQIPVMEPVSDDKKAKEEAPLEAHHETTLPRPEVIEATHEFIHGTMREVMKRFHEVCVTHMPDDPSVISIRDQMQDGWKAMLSALDQLKDKAKDQEKSRTTKEDADKLLKDFQTLVQMADENPDWSCPICTNAFDDQVHIPCKPAENYGEDFNAYHPEYERSVVPPTCKHTLCQDCSSNVVANEVSLFFQ